MKSTVIVFAFLCRWITLCNLSYELYNLYKHEICIPNEISDVCDIHI